MYSIDVEHLRARVQKGRGLDNKDNVKRHREEMAAMRAMRQLLLTSTSFEQRYAELHKSPQLEFFVDIEFAANYNPDDEEDYLSDE